MTSKYQVVIADWALKENGKSGDVLAIEHEHEAGRCLIHSTTLGYTADEISSAVKGHQMTCEFDEYVEPAQQKLARMISDLDRCEHGRHAGDICSGRGGCDGPSKGNPHMQPGQVVGYDISGRPYVMPENQLRTGDPTAWRVSD